MHPRITWSRHGPRVSGAAARVVDAASPGSSFGRVSTRGSFTDLATSDAGLVESWAALWALKAPSAPLRSKAWKVQPTRLSHALVFSPDIEQSIAFYTQALGLRLSDDSPGICFLHAPHGSDHHVIAFAKGSSAGLHHVSWSVTSFDDVGLGAMQMAEKGYDRGWGVGRHVLGSNYFHYVRDPWGSYSEYSFDIDHIPSSMDWPASTQSPEDGFYLCGPGVPKDFIINYEAPDAPPAS